MRWGPVVASVVSALALTAAALTGISAFDRDTGQEFGLVRLDGLVGEVLLVLAVAFVALGVAVAMRRAPAGAFIGVGIVTAVVAFISRWSLSSDATSVSEYIVGAGSASGIDSRLVDAAGGDVTRVDVDSALTVLAMAGAAALVAVGWAAWVQLDERRRRSVAGASVAGASVAGVAVAPVPLPAPEPITDSSQLPHT